MSHGYTISPDGPDPLVELADKAVGTVFSEACQAGKWLVDVIPIRKFHLILDHPISDQIVFFVNSEESTRVVTGSWIQEDSTRMGRNRLRFL